ncbi:hypothetical protein [Bacillus sp. UMB0728]|uniref:hypothetical protein n=1 Tax=Bacillus sp. UMB0728 TaxID=2066052 RepID=UPI000C77A9F6|nr:hypothetical protein [Bacillus sp. UMB0728]PLR72323.1 hypothetical protein CYJ37_12265 [Bacillus sp. UMB0728]
MGKLDGILRYNQEKKLDLDYLRRIFILKKYLLLTTEYVGNKQKLDFVCSKHPELKTQTTNAVRLRKITHNCLACQKESKLENSLLAVSNIDIIETYKAILSGKLKTFPKGFFQHYSLKDLKGLVNYYISVAKNETDDIAKIVSHDMLRKYKLSGLLKENSNFEILDLVYPNLFKPWELSSCPPKFWNNEDNVREASIWFYQKLLEDKVINSEEEILTIKNYGVLFKKYKLDGLFYTRFSSSHYGFWNYLFPNKWLEWEYCHTPKHYWENPENRIKALKELIELKLNMSISNIPNEFSYSLLVKQHRKFAAICDIYYSSSLFQWINECYPNTFTDSDFYQNIGIDGTKLDSKAEVKIHDIFIKNNLKVTYFENKIANIGNFVNEDHKESYIPDWIINDSIIVEYYGWYNDKYYETHKLLKKYMDKARRKNNYYKGLPNYQFIDLYPSDLEDNLKGLIKKFKSLGINLTI